MTDDMPGPSGVAPLSQPKVAWTIPKSKEEEKEVVDPLKNAWTDFTERISVAGWKEAFDEPIVWIRQQYKVALIILSAFSFYYTYQVIGNYVTSGYVDEITDFAELASVPASNVTICAQVYFNQTFIRENLIIPLGVQSKIDNSDETALDDFYRQLALYLTPIARPKEINLRLVPLFDKIVRANAQIRDFTSFAMAAWPKCDDVLRKCQFAGVEFDCCENAAMSFDDDGVCFLIPMNMESDNAYPSDSTVHQESPGPDGGLTVEARLLVHDFPFISNDAQNGFRVLVGHTSMSIVSSPIGVPHGSETYIKVAPEKHALASKCSPHGKLHGHYYTYYDPEGKSCAAAQAIDRTAEFGAACHVPMYTYHPNVSIVCPPRVMNMVTSVLAEQNYEKGFIETGDAEAMGLNKKKMNKNLKAIEAAMKSSFSDKARCPYHCVYWTYQCTASFNYLEKQDDNAKVDYMFSRIHVYYGNLDCRQRREVRESSLYLAFCDFGNVVGLYWGMSIVSFFHVFYYVPRYFYVKRKMRRMVSDQTTVVHFAAGSIH